MEKTTLQDGIYKNSAATFFIKDGKVMMRLLNKRGLYKTTTSFMIGAEKYRDLDPSMINSFDETYEKVKSW